MKIILKEKNNWLSGNQHNKKPIGETSNINLNIRCKSSDKESWANYAKAEGLNLTQWIIRQLNAKISSN